MTSKEINQDELRLSMINKYKDRKTQRYKYRKTERRKKKKRPKNRKKGKAERQKGGDCLAGQEWWG